MPGAERGPWRLERVGGDVLRGSFRRGKGKPRGVRWFGARSFWGHLRHFAASAVATEDIDSRDWMTPDEPHELSLRIARLIERGRAKEEGGKAMSLTEQIGRDLWIDYLADTGDDADVSAAVADMLVRDYVVPEVTPGTASGVTGSGGGGPAQRREVIAPRGDILFFGGDTAYPVATAEEIHDRVVVPFNRVLDERYDGRARALIGIPGNHDWYDGLDGFARLFRRRPYEQMPAAAGTMHDTLQRSEIARYTEFAKRFVRGEHVEKPGTLDLVGYRPVQSASYFALPLAPGVHLYAADRQLRNIDYRQRQYFESWRLRHPRAERLIVLPDPPHHFGEENPSGRRMVRALGLDETRERALVLSGDIHHYERWAEGMTSYVIAGGGGAFLHPAPVTRKRATRTMEWPGPRQSRRLLWQVPWKVGAGRSGVLPHFAFGALLLPSVLALQEGAPLRAAVATLLAWAFVWVCFALIGGLRRRRSLALLLLAAGGALAVVAGPWLTQGVLGWVLGGSLSVGSPPALAEGLPPGGQGIALSAVILLLSSVGASVAFGVYLMMLTWCGIENTQAFTALDHPGFKHFLRMRVRHDGSGIDVWCIGLLDPLEKDARPVLVDAFFWRTR